MKFDNNRQEIPMRSVKRVGLRRRMFSLYLLGGVLPMAFVCIYLLSGTSQLLIEQAKNSEISELEMMRDIISESIKVTNDVSKFFYFDEELEHIAFYTYESYEEEVADYKNYTTFTDYRSYYIDVIKWICIWLENDTIHGNSRFVKVDDNTKQEEWYQKTLAENGKSVWSYQTLPTGIDEYLSLSRVIKSKRGEQVGIFRIYLNSECLQEPLDKREQETFIVLNKNQIIASNVEKNDEILSFLSDFEGDSIYETVLYNEKEYVLTAVNMDIPESKNKIIIASLQSASEILEQINQQRYSSLIIVSICVTFSVILIASYTKGFSKRINKFVTQMQKATKGDFEISEKIGGNDEITELYEYLNTMINSIHTLTSKVFEEQVQKEQLNSRKREVEFKMLASQINPHFLYNTLETIRMKARVNGELEIEELVKMLAELLRRTLQAGQNLVSISSELELLEYYLIIQKHRFGDRIQYEIKLEIDIEDIEILPLVMQPIVENAIIHGLEAREENGYVKILVGEAEASFTITITDNGEGIPEEVLEKIRKELNNYQNIDRTHIGISNVHQRVSLYYGEQYGIEINSKEKCGTTVIIHLPKDIKRGYHKNVQINDY